MLETSERGAAVAAWMCLTSQHATLPEAGPQTKHAQGGGQDNGECLSFLQVCLLLFVVFLRLFMKYYLCIQM